MSTVCACSFLKLLHEQKKAARRAAWGSEAFTRKCQISLKRNIIRSQREETLTHCHLLPLR